MRSLLEWLRSHPGWCLAVAVAGSLPACFLLANWTAENRWQHYAAAARARGVKMNMEDFAPPPIPDAQNFASLPILQAAFSRGAKPFDLPVGGAGRPSLGDPIKGPPIDWAAWQQHFATMGLLTETTEDPIHAVLTALETYAPQIAEWREWKTRPQCRFALDLKAGAAMPLSHLGTFQHAAFFFALRSRAHLALGDSPAAAEDFRDGLQAYRALSDEPTLISALVQMAALNLILSAVGEGLASHAWGDAELREIAADLQAVRIWDDEKRAFASERGFGNSICEQLVAASRWNRGQMVATFTAGPGGSTFAPGALAAIPRALYRNNQLRLNQYHDEIAARVGPRSAELDPDRVTTTGPERLAGVDTYYYFLFRLSAPIYSEIIRRFLTLETKLRQTQTALALERFRLARGAFPETLAELVPAFLYEVPGDLHAAAPMRYTRREPSSFRLYTLGRDREDQGGILDKKKTEQRQDDLVWLYAPAGN